MRNDFINLEEAREYFSFGNGIKRLLGDVKRYILPAIGLTTLYAIGLIHPDTRNILINYNLTTIESPRENSDLMKRIYEVDEPNNHASE